MRRFGGAGLAGGAAADRETLEIECNDKCFGFDVVEVEVGGVADAWSSCAVDATLFDAGEKTLFETITEPGEMYWSIFAEPDEIGRASCRERV